MVAGIGIDSIEKTRIADAVSRWGDRFLRKIYTGQELRDCRKKHDRTGSLAVRFAAKEAMFKALGTGWSEGIGWKDIEVATRAGGKPEIVLHRKAQELANAHAIHISLSHDTRTALAFVVLETKEE